MSENVKIILLSFLSRSGSSLIANNLSRDIRFCVCPEAETLTWNLLKDPDDKIDKWLYLKLLKDSKKDNKLKHWNINLPQFSNGMLKIELFKSVLINYRNQMNHDANYIVFKSEGLENFKVDNYANFFKLILIRDPRAVFLSQKTSFFSLGHIPMNINPIRTAKKFDYIFKSFNKSSTKEYVIKFEKYLNNQSEEESKIANALQIDEFSNTASFTFKEVIPKNQLHLHVNINSKPDVKVIDKWRNRLSEMEIFLLESNCAELETAGYSKSGIYSTNWIHRYLFLIRLYVNDYVYKTVKKILLYIN